MCLYERTLYIYCNIYIYIYIYSYIYMYREGAMCILHVAYHVPYSVLYTSYYIACCLLCCVPQSLLYCLACAASACKLTSAHSSYVSICCFLRSPIEAGLPAEGPGEKGGAARREEPSTKGFVYIYIYMCTCLYIKGETISDT